MFKYKMIASKFMKSDWTFEKVPSILPSWIVIFKIWTVDVDQRWIFLKSIQKIKNYSNLKRKIIQNSRQQWWIKCQYSQNEKMQLDFKMYSWFQASPWECFELIRKTKEWVQQKLWRKFCKTARKKFFKKGKYVENSSQLEIEKSCSIRKFVQYWRNLRTKLKGWNYYSIFEKFNWIFE